MQELFIMNGLLLVKEVINMKKIIFILLILPCFSKAQKLYAVRFNANSTSDSFFVRDGVPGVFNSSNNYVMPRIDSMLSIFGYSFPQAAGNFHLDADGIYRNYTPRTQAVDWTGINNNPGTTIGLGLFALATPASASLIRVNSNGTVATRTVTEAKQDLSIDQVNNTSDANKPVSTAQQTALDLKANTSSPVINTPTIGTSGNSGTSHIKTIGSIPTVAQTGLGTGGSVGVALETGSTDAAGIITLTTGTSSVGSTGTVTLTFDGAYSGNQPVIVLTLVKGATDWGALATVRVTTQSLTAPIFTWNNSVTGAAAALSTGTTYKISYVVIQK